MSFSANEPEPLAFRVRPRRDEAFDSWIDRLVTRHEVTRAELYRHLGCDPRLAARDLARGGLGLEKTDYPAFYHLVETLAWAVEVSPSQIEATFVPAPAAALLPRALRVFGCASCWLDAIQAGEPPIIARDWTLLASWMCLRHRLPLAPLHKVVGGAAPRAAARKLKTQVIALQRLGRRHPPTAAMLAFNRSLIGRLLGERGAGMRRGEYGYGERYAVNRFHLTRARIALLAAAHSERTRPSDRFEYFAGLSTSALLRSSAKALDPKTRPQNRSITPSMPEGIITVRINHWQASFSDMLDAYVGARRYAWSGLATGDAASMPEGATFAENRPQVPAGRVARACGRPPI